MPKQEKEMNFDEMMEMNLDDLEKSLESFGNVTEGAVVDGKVVEVTASNVFLDVNCKSEGILSTAEFGDSVPSVGDTVQVFLEKKEDRDGRPVISKSKADEQIKNAWNSMLVGIKPHKLEKLIELRKQYRIYLLSNTNIIHWDAAKEMFSWGEYKREDYFDDIFLSFEMHLCKPDPNIFRALTNRVSILPYNTLLLDDSEENCQAARSIGWQAHCVRQDEEWLTLF